MSDNIVLARIDDRLIHGQISTQWVKTTETNKILIIDEKLLEDEFQQRLLKSAAPAGIEIVFLSVTGTLKYMNEEVNVKDKIMILTKTPETMENLINKGLDIKKINLGGMGFKKGRNRFNRNVSASSEEIASMCRIIEKGVEIEYQLIPKETPVNIKKLLKRKGFKL